MNRKIRAPRAAFARRGWLAAGVMMAAIATLAPSATAQTTLIRVAQTTLDGNARGDVEFASNVVGVIKPWRTTRTAQDFYAYANRRFNGPVPLTFGRIHLFFVDASDGLAVGCVYDKPDGPDGGSAQMKRWIRPRSAHLINLSGIDRESNWCSNSFTRSGSDNLDWIFVRQAWPASETDGWMHVLNSATWTSVQTALTESPRQFCTGYGDFCADRALYTGLDSVAAISADESVVPLRLGQERVQFTPVAACAVVAWPSQQSACAGGTATFGVRPNATGTATFAWFHGGSPLTPSARVSITTSADGLESRVAISGLSAADAGTYTCTVTSSCGTTTTGPISLAVTSGAPTTTNPVGDMIPCGTGTTLGVTASGNGPFRYQWLKAGAPVHDITGHIDGSETAVLAISDAQPEQSGTYSCVVSNACGSVTSGSAVVEVVGTRPTIGRQPEAATACFRGSASFAVTVATGAPVTYQWQGLLGGNWVDLVNGAFGPGGAVVGATSPTLVLNGLYPAVATSYRVFISNGCGCVVSNAVALTMCLADLDNGSGTGTCDGGVTIEDLLYYTEQYALGTARADVDDGAASGTPDGGVTIDDLLYFLQRYEAGC
jgi:hypothetical protein